MQPSSSPPPMGEQPPYQQPLMGEQAQYQQQAYPPSVGEQPQYQQQAYYYPSYPGQPGYYTTPVQQVPQNKIVFKYGLIFGGILALVSLSINILSLTNALPFINGLAMPFQNNIDLFDLIYEIVWCVIQGVLAWIVYGVAGFMAARQTGQVRTGVFVCLWATLWYLIVDIALVIPFTIISYSQAGIPPDQMMQYLFNIHTLLSIVEGIVFDTFLALTAGLGIGAIGATIGKNPAVMG